jgi:hypothetical protein
MSVRSRVPADVVHAIFYNFADGEVARDLADAPEGCPRPSEGPRQGATDAAGGVMPTFETLPRFERDWKNQLRN